MYFGYIFLSNKFNCKSFNPEKNFSISDSFGLIKYGIGASIGALKKDIWGNINPVNSGKGLPSTTNSISELVFCVAGVILFIFYFL